MNIEITKKQEFPLLKRTKIHAIVKFDKSTPSRLDLKNAIATKLGTSADNIIIQKINTKFCERSAEVIIHSYKNEEDLKKAEGEKIIAKNKPKAEKKE